MDPILSIVMSNLALVRRHDVVVDPFCGTAGILIPAAKLGAKVVGIDMDLRALRGRANGTRDRKNLVVFPCPVGNAWCDPARNFAQYGLDPPLALLNMDMGTQMDALLFRRAAAFDAIVTDPPYGIREAAKAAKSDGDEALAARDTDRPYVPQTARMRLHDVMLTLLEFAERALPEGRRVVFWLPTARETYKEEDLPRWPGLRLLYNCEQVLTMRLSRRLLVMEKTGVEEKEAARREMEAEDKEMVARRGHDDLSAMVFRNAERSEGRARKGGWHVRE